jgi:hypothetical protein
MAAVLPFTQKSGWLHGRFFPFARGAWHSLNIEAAFHHYMTHWKVTFQFADLIGSSPLPAVAEGYINLVGLV